MNLVGDEAVRRLLQPVQDVVETRAYVVQILGIHGRNERLIQAREDLVDDPIALTFKFLNSFGGVFEPFTIGDNALLQKHGRLADQLHLPNKEVEEFLFAGKESHMFKERNRRCASKPGTGVPSYDYLK